MMNRIAIVSMVKNEADIIESFVRYAAYLADIVLVADHSSSDGTREILEALQKEGLSLHIQTITEPGHIQAEVINCLYHQAVRQYKADLVVPLDADEFLLPTKPMTDVRKILQQLALDQAYCLEWWNYAPYQQSLSAKQFLLNGTCVRSEKAEQNHKCMVGRLFMEEHHGYIAQGNHFVIQKDTRQILNEEWIYSMRIVHFPWRSSAQYASKIGVGWLNNVVKYSADTAYAAHYERLFRKLLTGESIGREEFISQPELVNLQEYVPRFSLQYTKEIDEKTVLRNVLMASRLIAQQLCEERYCRKKELVTVVLVFNGNWELWQESVQNLKEQQYPWLEFFVLDFTGALNFDSLDIEKWPVFILTDSETMFDELSQRVKGKYVQWMFPGDLLKPEKIIRMAVSMNEILPGHIGIASDVWHKDDVSFPGFDLHKLNDYVWYSLGTAELRQAVISNKESLCGGLASLLLRRSVMDECNWLAGCFLDGKPLYLTMWYQIFRTQKSGNKLGIIHESFLLRRSGVTDYERSLMLLEGEILRGECQE